MSSDSPFRPAPAVPDFPCRIPEELLKDLPPAQQQSYRQSDRLDQKMDWLLDHAIAQAQTLEEVRVQATKTNGSVIQAKADIVALKEAVAAQVAATTPVVRAYGVAKTLAKSRLFWVGAAAFVLIGLPALLSVAPAPLTFLKAAVAVFLGG